MSVPEALGPTMFGIIVMVGWDVSDFTSGVSFTGMPDTSTACFSPYKENK